MSAVPAHVNPLLEDWVTSTLEAMTNVAGEVLIHENGAGAHDPCSKLWRQEGGSVDEASRRSKSQSFGLPVPRLS